MTVSSTVKDMGVEARLDVRAVGGGGQELCGFIGPGDQRIFVVAHLPAAPAQHALVACPATYSEQLTSYRTEVLLARHLMGHGVATVRFQYRGTGNSDDPPGEFPTFSTMCEDAASAAQWLSELIEQRNETTDLTFLGTRLGALIAAHATAHHAGSRLALIEPALEGRRYFRELFRARQAAALRRDVPAQTEGADGARSLLQERGELDAFGSRIGWATVSTLTERTVDAELDGSTPPLLLVQLAGGQELRKETLLHVDRWRNQGITVTTEAVRQGRGWWFVPEEWETEEQRPETAGLLRAVTGWLTKEPAPA